KHVHRIAGWTGQYARPRFTAVAQRPDRIADRLLHSLRQPAELADVEVDPTHLVGLALLRDQHHFRLDDPGVANHAPARLNDGFRDGVAKMLAQRPEYGISVGFHGRHLFEVLGREAAAEIDHSERNAALRAGAENRGSRLERLVPGLRAALLGADM